ncbi:MAG: Ig-like domain repeat protein [Eubacterium sp.]|nr:Ig-like domain repeat protein [Eubacterium sp.]
MVKKEEKKESASEDSLKEEKEQIEGKTKEDKGEQTRDKAKEDSKEQAEDKEEESNREQSGDKEKEGSGELSKDKTKESNGESEKDDYEKKTEKDAADLIKEDNKSQASEETLKRINEETPEDVIKKNSKESENGKEKDNSGTGESAEEDMTGNPDSMENDQDGNNEERPELPSISDFSVEDEDICTKEGSLWYARYDSSKGRAHVGLSFRLTGDQIKKVEIVANPGGITVECDRDQDGTCHVDFDREGSWTFTASVEDEEGQLVTEKLVISETEHEPVVIRISNARPSLIVSYANAPYGSNSQSDQSNQLSADTGDGSIQTNLPSANAGDGSIYYNQDHNTTVFEFKDELGFPGGFLENEYERIHWDCSIKTPSDNHGADLSDTQKDSESEIQLEDGIKVQSGNCKAAQSAERVTETSYQAEYTFSEEGTYLCEISYRAKNGRVPLVTEVFPNSRINVDYSSGYRGRPVIVDMTPPRLRNLKISAGDNKEIINEGLDYIYLNNKTKAQAQVSFAIEDAYPDESSFSLISGNANAEKASGHSDHSDTDETNVTSSRIADGQELPLQIESRGGSLTECISRLQIDNWKKEGTFALGLGEIKDRAGNALIVDEEDARILGIARIVVDRTAPTMKITYPEPKGRVTNSKRLQENNNELFFQEHPEVSIELTELNYRPVFSDPDLEMYIYSRETDEKEEYRKSEGRKESFEAGDKDGSWMYLIDTLPASDSHSYFTISYTDFSGNQLSDIEERIRDNSQDMNEKSSEDSRNDVYEQKGSDSRNEAHVLIDREGRKTYYSPVITIDHIAPVIETTFNRQPVYSWNKRDYYQKVLVMTLTVTDENFDIDDFEEAGNPASSMVYDAWDYDEETEDIKEESLKPSWMAGVTWDHGRYIKGRKQYTGTVEFSDENNYDIRTRALDLAGNQARQVTDQVTIDHTSPYILLQDRENTKSSDVSVLKGETGSLPADFFDYRLYGYFHRGQIRVKVQAHDKVSGICRIKYTIIHEDGTSNQGDWDFNSPDGSRTRWITIPGNAKDRIYLRAIDFAQNAGAREEPRGIVTESESYHKTHSRIGVTFDSKPSNVSGGIKYFNKAVRANISMEDTHSGIRSYSYQAGNVISASHDYGAEVGSEDKKGPSGRDITYQVKFHPEIAAGSVNYSSPESPTRLQAEFTDHVGHSTTLREDIVIDDKAPVIQITWSSNVEPMNGKYYRDSRTAAITVTERNFDEKRVTWKISPMSGVEIGSWKHDGDIHTCRVAFPSDGDDYLLDFSITDLAGNKADCPPQEAFTIDKTAPVIFITFDYDYSLGNTGYSNLPGNSEYYNHADSFDHSNQPDGSGYPNKSTEPGKINKSAGFYNRSRTATLHVQEHNFRGEDVNYLMTSRYEGKDIAGPAPSGWTSRGDIHTAKVNYNFDGEFGLGFTYTDLAGNPAAKIETEHFIIDLTRPEVHILGVEDGSAYNDKVMPVVEYSDTNLDEQSVSVQLTRAKKGPVSYLMSEPELIHNGKRIRWEDFQHAEKIDDIYTLEVSVRDKAGNVNDSSRVVFSVNRYGSNYVFGPAVDTLLGSGHPYLKEPIPIEVTEINVSGLKEKEVHLRNEYQETIILKEGKDYRVTERQNKVKWKEYFYEIYASNFTEEGQYSVILSSLDQADNQMTSLTRDKHIDFVIDRTPPAGSISGLEEKRYLEDRHKIYVRADDNYALKEAVLYVDRKAKKKYDASDFESGYSVEEVLEGKHSIQKVSLTMTDWAGNEALVLPDGNPGGSLITSNRWVQFYHNPLLVCASIAALLLLVIGVGLVVYRKRMRD